MNVHPGTKKPERKAHGDLAFLWDDDEALDYVDLSDDRDLSYLVKDFSNHRDEHEDPWNLAHFFNFNWAQWHSEKAAHIQHHHGYHEHHVHEDDLVECMRVRLCTIGTIPQDFVVTASPGPQTVGISEVTDCEFEVVLGVTALNQGNQDTELTAEVTWAAGFGATLLDIYFSAEGELTMLFEPDQANKATLEGETHAMDVTFTD